MGSAREQGLRLGERKARGLPPGPLGAGSSVFPQRPSVPTAALVSSPGPACAGSSRGALGPAPRPPEAGTATFEQEFLSGMF